MTLELDNPELEATAPQIKPQPQELKGRPCPYFFFDEEEDDFMYFKW